MNYLLDTHTFIWAITDSKKLSAPAIKVIENINNTVFVSTISLWEISLKFSLHKLDITGFFPQDLPGLAIKSGFTVIPLLPEEAATYHNLQGTGEHKDPFDKMITWQAIKQDLILISKDKSITQYKQAGLKLLW